MTTIHSAAVVLPYQHRQFAVAGLRAELRHLVQLASLLGRREADEQPDWDTLVITGPTGTRDAQGREWFEYTATVHAYPAGRSTGATGSPGPAGMPAEHGPPA
jgi:hypothetical protein